MYNNYYYYDNYLAGNIKVDLKGHSEFCLNRSMQTLGTAICLPRILPSDCPLDYLEIQEYLNTNPNYLLDTYNLPYIDLYLNDSFRCISCSEKVKFRYDGRTLTAIDSCQHNDGVPWDLELNIPSGKIVLANDLRKLFDPTMFGLTFQVNYLNQLKQCEYYYASLGLLHCFVGNTSPAIYKLQNEITIGNPGLKLPKVGSICTDLWWISACDYDDFITKGGDIEEAEAIVDVTPGTYICESRYSIEDRDNYDLFIKMKLSLQEE